MAILMELRYGMHRHNRQERFMLTSGASVDCMVSGRNDKYSLWSVHTKLAHQGERNSGLPEAPQLGKIHELVEVK